jgi:hypothetical protein
MTLEVIERIEPQGAMVAQPQSPSYLLQLAVEQGADIDKLERLMALKERYDKIEAQKAFNADFARFKSAAITIIRTKKITDGPLKGKHHAELAGIVNAVTPELSKFGLSVSWKLTKDERDWMEVTCTLGHIGGHVETVSMGGAPDTGPGRNAIQARGSVKSYLERYTVLAILGMAAQDADDDGAGGAKDQGKTDITHLLVGLGGMKTDSAAHQYWIVNREALKDDWAAGKRFKDAVIAHRQAIARGAV